MTEAESFDWVCDVDEVLAKKFLRGAHISFDNACELVDEAQVLLTAGHCRRSAVLAITAQEELGKALMLFAIINGRQWNSGQYRVLTEHSFKHALIDMMKGYVQWFKEANSFAIRLSQESLASARVPLQAFPLPETQQLHKKSFDRRKKKNTKDKLRQRLLYTRISKNGAATRPDDITFEEANVQIEEAQEFKALIELVLNHPGQVL